MLDAKKTIQETPTKVLCKAAGQLQEAHDYIEMHQFDIGAYGANKGSGVCCYIGSVRQVAGEHGVSPDGPSRNQSAEIALLALDRAALEMGAPLVDRYSRHGGGIVEHWGFGNTKRGHTKDGALEVYRQAIREVQTELMERTDLPKPTLRERLFA